jgi:uncharacterized protein YndB with AHSA1/START domain
MIKAIVIVVVVAIAGVLAYAAIQPNTFRVQRSTVIQAPPEKVYAILEDFDRGKEWSPFEKKDPNLKRSRSGPPKGKGAVYSFEGNSDVGAGSLTVLDTAPPSKLVLALDMTKPMEGHNTVEYTLVPEGGGTRMTWSIFGPMPFISKVMCLFIDMDKMIGKEFESGLASLKALAEK